MKLIARHKVNYHIMWANDKQFHTAVSADEIHFGHQWHNQSITEKRCAS